MSKVRSRLPPSFSVTVGTYPTASKSTRYIRRVGQRHRTSNLMGVVGERFGGQAAQILGAAEHRSGMYWTYM
jgi:hypothetical protein